MTDAERLDWLEAQARKGEVHIDGGNDIVLHVPTICLSDAGIESGCPQHTSLRGCIDAAAAMMAAEQQAPA